MTERYITVGDWRAVVGSRNRRVYVAPGLVLEVPGKRRYASVVEVVYSLDRGCWMGVAEPILVGGDVRFVGVENTHVVFRVG